MEEGVDTLEYTEYGEYCLSGSGIDTLPYLREPGQDRHETYNLGLKDLM